MVLSVETTHAEEQLKVNQEERQHRGKCDLTSDTLTEEGVDASVCPGEVPGYLWGSRLELKERENFLVRTSAHQWSRLPDVAVNVRVGSLPTWWVPDREALHSGAFHLEVLHVSSDQFLCPVATGAFVL